MLLFTRITFSQHIYMRLRRKTEARSARLAGDLDEAGQPAAHAQVREPQGTDISRELPTLCGHGASSPTPSRNASMSDVSPQCSAVTRWRAHAPAMTSAPTAAALK